MAVRVAVTYRFVAVDLVTGARIATLPLRGARFGRVLNGAGPFSATLKLSPVGVVPPDLSAVWPAVWPGDWPGMERSDPAKGATLNAAWIDATEQTRRAIYVERNGVVVWPGPVWLTDYDADEQAITIQGAEMWSWGRRRRIRWDATYATTDQLEIARDLIDEAQTQPGGDLGIVTASETSGVLRDRTYNAWEDKPVAEAIEQMAAVDDGFDFSLDVDRSGSTYTRTFRLFYPRKGAEDSGHVFTLGSNLISLSYPSDGSRAANSWVALGSGEGDAMLLSTATDSDLIAQGYPLLEDSVSFKDVSVQDTLDGHAASALASGRLPVTLPTASVWGEKAPTFGSYEVGDDVRLRVPPNRDPRWPDGLDVSVRINAWSITVPDDGAPEIIDLTFEPVGASNPNQAETEGRRLAETERRLRTLETAPR